MQSAPSCTLAHRSAESILRCQVLGLQLNRVEEEEDEEGLYMRRGRHSETRGKWLVLWEFAPFEMQIPHRAERAGETGVRGSALLRG